LDTTNGKIIAVKKYDFLGRELEFATREIANFRINRDKSIKHVSHGAISCFHALLLY
jgi:hypothetical protein